MSERESLIAARPRGKCATCGRVMMVKNDGNMAAHHDDGRPSRYCSGSGQPARRPTVGEQAHALYLRTARECAERALRDPYAAGGGGSMLEQALAVRVLALCKEYDHA